MASGNDTKATQTEEEEEDCPHLTAKNINFKCPEGITTKIEKFEVIPKRGFFIVLKLDGIRYQGVFLEAIDSFAPINYIPTKRRRPTFSKNYKTRPSVVTRTKKPNAFSRENFPQGYIDTYNTIEARLRYGRDKNIPGFNSLLSPGDSASQSKDDSILKSNRKKKSNSVVAGSASNTDSSISVKSNSKMKSQSVVARSASDSSPSSVSKYKRKPKYLKRTENGNVSEITSNENSSPPFDIFMPEMSENLSSDTSVCSSLTKMTCKNDKRQTKVYFTRSSEAMKDKLLDLNSGLRCIVSTPRTDTESQSMNIDDTLQSVTSSQDSLSRVSEPNLIVFSPEINIEQQCRKGHESVENVSTTSQLSEPDLITFSPDVNIETNLKTKGDNERSVAIKYTASNFQFSTLSEASCKASETVSSQFFHDELVYKPEKLGDVQYIEDEDNILNTNEKSINLSTGSKLQNTIGMKNVSIDNLVSNKITLNEGNSSSESLLIYKSNADEIQETNSSFEIKYLNTFQHHLKCLENRKEIIGVNLNEISLQNQYLQFKSTEKNTTYQ